MTKAVIDFTENGIHYHAEKGFAFADKNGQIDEFDTLYKKRTDILVKCIELLTIGSADV